MRPALSLGSHAIEIWCSDDWIAKTAQVPPPKIIAKDDDEIGFLGGVLGSVHRACDGAAVTDGLDEQEATKREEDKGDADLSHRRKLSHRQNRYARGRGAMERILAVTSSNEFKRAVFKRAVYRPSNAPSAKKSTTLS